MQVKSFPLSLTFLSGLKLNLLLLPLHENNSLQIGSPHYLAPFIGKASVRGCSEWADTCLHVQQEDQKEMTGCAKRAWLAKGVKGKQAMLDTRLPDAPRAARDVAKIPQHGHDSDLFLLLL